MSVQFIEPTNDQRRRWQDRGLCFHCGLDSDDKCRCRFCSSCVRTWLANTFAPYADTDFGLVPRAEYCPDCIASLCVDCGLSACHDVHDSMITGAGKHPYNDGECTALAVYDSRFKFGWSYIADCAEIAFINECKTLSARMRETTAMMKEAIKLAA